MNSNYQTPEGKAREHIDKMLNDEGWNVVSRSAIEVDKPMAVKEAILIIFSYSVARWSDSWRQSVQNAM